MDELNRVFVGPSQDEMLQGQIAQSLGNLVNRGIYYATGDPREKLYKGGGVSDLMGGNILGGMSPQELQQLPLKDKLAIAKYQQSLRQEQQKTQESELKQQNLAYKEQKGYIEELAKKAEADKELLTTLDRMEYLNEQGNVQGPISNKIFNALKLGGYRTSDTQEFEKLSGNFFKLLKTYFGARPSNLEVKALMRTIPSLEQNQEGRRQLIRQMRILTEASGIKKKIAEQIIQEYGYPRNLRQMVDQIAEPMLDDLYAEFIGTTKAMTGMDTLPNPSQYVNKKIRDKETGEIFISNGSEWLRG